MDKKVLLISDLGYRLGISNKLVCEQGIKNMSQVKIRGKRDRFPLIPYKNVKIERFESIYFDLLIFQKDFKDYQGDSDDLFY